MSGRTSFEKTCPLSVLNSILHVGVGSQLSFLALTSRTLTDLTEVLHFSDEEFDVLLR